MWQLSSSSVTAHCHCQRHDLRSVCLKSSEITDLTVTVSLPRVIRHCQHCQHCSRRLVLISARNLYHHHCTTHTHIICHPTSVTYLRQHRRGRSPGPSWRPQWVGPRRLACASAAVRAHVLVRWREGQWGRGSWRRRPASTASPPASRRVASWRRRRACRCRTPSRRSDCESADWRPRRSTARCPAAGCGPRCLSEFWSGFW